MKKTRIVKVNARLRGCEILVDTPEKAKEVMAKCIAEGVWEARNGIRWMVISPHEITKVWVVNPHRRQS